jgi:probable F420-dependent oxidoreductase
MVEFGVSLPTGREGLMVPSGFASKETIVDAAVRAEELGFDSVWGNDHITIQEYVSHVRPKPSFYEPLISMAAVSSVTERVRLGTGIFVLPWRTPALVVCAKQLATLDVLSSGRLLLGIGTGAYPEESASLGIGGRLRRMNEGYEALRALFEEDPATYEGRYVRFRGVELYPRPLQRPFPVYVGRHLTTERVLRWVARHAQGWIPGLTPSQFAEAIPRLGELMAEYGRNLREMDVVREVSLSLAGTREEALRAYMGTPAQAHMRSLSEGKKLVGFYGELDVSLIGDARDVIRGIEAYLEAGVTHFMLNIAVSRPGDLTQGMERFSEEVMPSYR